jgi:hypothetical protein
MQATVNFTYVGTYNVYVICVYVAVPERIINSDSKYAEVYLWNKISQGPVFNFAPGGGLCLLGVMLSPGGVDNLFTPPFL